MALYADISMSNSHISNKQKFEYIIYVIESRLNFHCPNDVSLSIKAFTAMFYKVSCRKLSENGKGKTVKPIFLSMF